MRDYVDERLLIYAHVGQPQACPCGILVDFGEAGARLLPVARHDAPSRYAFVARVVVDVLP